MEAISYLPEGKPQTPEIKIFQVFEDGEMFHHLSIDGSDIGRIDWEESNDGHQGYIDGLDAEQELIARGIRKLAWLPIAQCMKQLHPEINEVWHLDGIVVLDGAGPEDFGYEP